MNFPAIIVFSLAAIPTTLFLLNLLIYRRLPGRKRAVDHGEPESCEGMSVLIPARNEEQNIRRTVEAVLANATSALPLEIIVLDDHSDDRTAAIIKELAAKDGRLRLESAPALPAGWCGKQHACHVLAKRARHDVFVFIDADVRLTPDALERLECYLEEHPEVALASGVPRQELETFSERLLIPLIHFILLGFLPMHAMRRSRLPALSAGCGQLFIARRAAYEKCGGHAQLRESLHDGIQLPRVFRRAGFNTGLFDATDLATCRMYHTNAETWRGLGKNATEGLAAPGTILPMTLLLIGGQVMPFVLLAKCFLGGGGQADFFLAIAAVCLSFLPRIIAAANFRQPVVSVLLHPLGVIALLVIQWHALIAHIRGKPAIWKGRSYSLTPPVPTP